MRGSKREVEGENSGVGRGMIGLKFQPPLINTPYISTKENESGRSSG